MISADLQKQTEPSALALTIRSILLISLWAGLVTGVLEVLIQLFQKFVLHEIIGLSLDLIWMAPLADALIFLAVGVLFSLYAGRFARVNNIRVLVFILAFLGAFSTIQYLPIHWLAMEILSVGLAVTAANTVQRKRDSFHRLVRSTTSILLVVVALAGIGLRIYHWNQERQALANLPAAEPGLPNVLLIVMDTVRAENLSLYGYQRDTTPVLRELAKQGVVFENAFSTAPWTLPSHASMFTGHWAHELSADWGIPLDDSYPTLAEVLQANGYQTAGFSGNTFYVTYEYGLDRGFLHFEDFDSSIVQVFMNSLIGRSIACNGQHGMGCLLRKYSIFSRIFNHRKLARKVNNDALKWVTNHSNKPYFLFINYIEAHQRNLTPQPFDTAFDPKRPPFSKIFAGDGSWDGTSAETQREENAYDESILYLDYEIGVLLEHLETRGLLDNTLIIITSDHGEEFQEHKVMSHGNSLYRQSVQVPLLMIFPDHLAAGKKVQEPVSLRDIPATILDLIGQADRSPFPGDYLTSYVEKSVKNPATMDQPILTELSRRGWEPGYYPISKGNMKALVADGFRYILNGDGSEELYDFNHDPQEMNDLADTSEGQAELPEYRLFLESTLIKSVGR